MFTRITVDPKPAPYQDSKPDPAFLHKNQYGLGILFFRVKKFAVNNIHNSLDIAATLFYFFTRLGFRAGSGFGSGGNRSVGIPEIHEACRGSSQGT